MRLVQSRDDEKVQVFREAGVNGKSPKQVDGVWGNSIRSALNRTRDCFVGFKRP